MPDVAFREASATTTSEGRQSPAHAPATPTVTETGPSTRRDSNARGEGGYFDGYMEGY